MIESKDKLDALQNHNSQNDSKIKLLEHKLTIANNDKQNLTEKNKENTKK